EPDIGSDVVLPNVGDRVVGTIRKIFDDNVLLDLGNGLMARLHRSRVSLFDRKPDLARVFSVGERLEAVVMRVHNPPSGTGRIWVSRRELGSVRPQDLPTRFPPGTVRQGRVSEHLPFGAFLRFEDEFIGLLHDSEVSWTDR